MTQPFLNLVKHRVTHSKGARDVLLGSRESQILLSSLGVRLWFYEMHMFTEKGWVINQSNRNLKGAKSSDKIFRHNYTAQPLC